MFIVNLLYVLIFITHGAYVSDCDECIYTVY